MKHKITFTQRTPGINRDYVIADSRQPALFLADIERKFNTGDSKVLNLKYEQVEKPFVQMINCY